MLENNSSARKYHGSKGKRPLLRRMELGSKPLNCKGGLVPSKGMPTFCWILMSCEKRRAGWATKLS